MSITSAVVRELMAAGLEGEALVAALERIEAASAPVRTPRQEANRRYYEANKEHLQAKARDRKANLKPSETSETRLKPSETKAEPSPPLVPPSSPQTPNHPPYNPPTPGLSEGRAKARKNPWPSNFESEFWRLWPHKVAKAEGLKALGVVHRADKTPWDVIIAGIERLVSHVDPQFYPHPATWIRGERWNDQHRKTGPPARQSKGGNAFAELAFQFDQQMKDERYEPRGDDIEIIPPGRSHP